MTTKGHIEGGWEIYQRKVLPPNASAVQVSETRKGFYAGASFLLVYILNVLEPGSEPTEADLELMDAIDGELRAFAEKGGE